MQVITVVYLRPQVSHSFTKVTEWFMSSDNKMLHIKDAHVHHVINLGWVRSFTAIDEK